MAYGVRGATPENVMLQVREKRLSAIATMSVRGIEVVVINEGKVCFDFRQRFNASYRKILSTCRSQGIPSMVLSSLFARPKPY